MHIHAYTYNRYTLNAQVNHMEPCSNSHGTLLQHRHLPRACMYMQVYACTLYVLLCISWYLYVYACIEYVYACICMYIQECAIKDAQAEKCNGLTDDRVSAHVLVDDSGIAAQINKQERDVSAGMPLTGCISYLDVFFVNDTGILANTYKYIHIHAHTCTYMHIHSYTRRLGYTWQAGRMSLHWDH